MKKLLILGLVVLGVLLGGNAWGQTNPAVFDLSSGNYSFTSQTATNTTYPANMQGWTTGTNNLIGITTAAPGADQTLVASGTATTSGLSNLGSNGFNFLSTSSNPNRQVGALCLALNTTGRVNVTVGWLVDDQTTGSTREMNMSLQYRLGTSGVFTTVSGSTYTTSNSSDKASQTFSGIILPVECENQAIVQLRWISYESSGQAGGRDAIRLDEIAVSSTLSSSPSITVTPTTRTGFTYIAGAGPSASQTYTLSGANLDPAAGNITVAASANYEVSIDDVTYTSSSFDVPYTANTLANTTIYVRLKAGLAVATYNGETVANSGGGTVSAQNVTCSGSVTAPPPPTITVTPTTRTGFTYIAGAGPSTSQTYTLSGANLDPAAGDLTVAASANYEVSADGVTYTSSSFNVSYTAGTLAATTIYVRLKAGLTAGTYNSEAVVNSGGNATSQNVTCSGSVTQPPVYFRTKASGLWSDIATWEVSTDQMTWSNATAAPTTTDLTVSLVSPHNVTINTSVSADQLTIQSGSILDLASTGTLSIANGAGTDLLVEGTFINGGSFIFSGVLEVANGGVYKHNPSSGGGTIPSFTWVSGSTCEVVKAGGRPTNLTQAYSNFTWNNTSQTTEINLNGELTSISGNFYVQSTGSSNLRMIGSAQTTTVGGNLEIAAGAILNLSGTSANQIINLSGNLVVNGTLTELGTSTNSRIVFSGTSSSAVTVGGSGLISNTVNFEINKTAGGSVVLNSDLLLPVNFTFTSGQVRTNGYTFAAANLISGFTSTAYFCTCDASGATPVSGGGLRMNQGVSATTLYPVGPTSSYYMPVTLTSGAGHVADNFTVRVEPLGTSGVTPTDNTKCIQYQWDISEGTAGGSNVQVKLQWAPGTQGAGFDPSFEPNIGHWNGTAFSPVSVALYTMGDPSFSSVSNFTSFSPFVAASGYSVLPIELLSFNATKQSNHTLLSFATASERNNERFEIERSADGRTFQVIGVVKGAGDAQTQNNYTFTDEHPLRGINYYRLRQVDVDGASTLSQVVSVTFGKTGNVVLYPTPANETMNVRFDEAFTTDANWQIVDLTGRILNEGIFAAEQTEFRIPVASLTQGAYILRVTASNEVVTQQFRKQ